MLQSATQPTLEDKPAINDIVSDSPVFSCFLVKIVSRCNLNCDYCYMYQHADQSWKNLPVVLSDENRKLLAFRIAEYAQEKNLKRVTIIFHGGEPLLAGAERITETARWIREELPSTIKVDFCLQTNGTLLDKASLDQLIREDITISLSLDGPKEANDLHRLTPKGNSSFDKTLNGLKLLQAASQNFTGIIGVIDPIVEPETLLSFFDEIKPPSLDFLLPDANYLAPPKYRDHTPDIYEKWLIKAFDLWFDKYAHLPVRFFDALLNSIAGIPSQTDSFGFGDVSLLNIETDGTYHDLDVLRITKEGGTALGHSLKSSPISAMAATPQILKHRSLMRKEGLSELCQQCSIVDICGGGAVPHRFNSEGFNNPTIYCREMKALVAHAQKRMQEQIKAEEVKKSESSQQPHNLEVNLASYNNTEPSSPEVGKLLKLWKEKAVERFLSVLPEVKNRASELGSIVDKITQLPILTLERLVQLPSVHLWTHVLEFAKYGRTSYSIDGIIIPIEVNYIKEILKLAQSADQDAISIHREDNWLRYPFGKQIIFEPQEVGLQGKPIVLKALDIIQDWDKNLLNEIKLLCPEIQFIRDPAAHPEKIVSFSDNIVPGALYVGIKLGEKYIDPYDLADSIIHEYRHQKLYLLEEFKPIVSNNIPLVSSPWREELRPPSGLFHAVFVFTDLRRFWLHVLSTQTGELQRRAKSEIEVTDKRLAEGFTTLHSCALTSTGEELLAILEENAKD